MLLQTHATDFCIQEYSITEKHVYIKKRGRRVWTQTQTQTQGMVVFFIMGANLKKKENKNPKPKIKT